ncbi:MAG TPA: DegQ family serine endoprotease [Thermodesulfovibrionales bacterium]|nr:DegQ family serine endoprotease [Thermodesulfovibrionales bacterium]
MKCEKASIVVSISVMVGLVMGFWLYLSMSSPLLSYAEEPRISEEAVGILSKASQAMAEVASAVKPAVVNISSTQIIKTPGMQSPFFNDPFFKRFFGDEFGHMEKPRERKQASLGSGVIVDGRGYILTNNHVIKGASEIKIRLSDKREFVGKVIGVDPKTDLAVVKIEASNLPALKWGNSDKLRPGDMVLAVGNPFGLSQTVTSGIVSATGRANVGIADYEDFIQTDAPINPGNSGGALVNVRGELVGINTAIFSTSGGYQGIGFAIPSSMARVVMDSLVNEGKVVRGWLGVSIQQVTPELAKQFSLSDERGVLISDVSENSPAEKAGLQRGDVITEFDGRPVDEPTGLRNMVAGTPLNKEVKIRVIREGELKTFEAVIAELPSEMQKTPGKFDNLLNGVSVQNLTPDKRKSLGISKNLNGVIVADIEEGSSAAGMLATNDVILEINRKKIHSMKDYEAVVSKIKSDQNILVLIYRNGSTIYLTLSAK